MIDNQNAIAIVTTTYYPKWSEEKSKRIEDSTIEKVRGDLALETLTQARKKGFILVVIDGGSSSSLKKKMRQLGINFTISKKRDLSLNRKQGFKKASLIKGIKVICFLEPEKVSMVKTSLPKVVEPILNNKSDIIIPKRNLAAFDSYPTYQKKIEIQAVKEWNNILREHNILNSKEDLDIWFGPKFFKNDPSLVNIFLETYASNIIHKDDIWSAAIILPIITALKRGYRVKSEMISYTHPRKQTLIEAKNKLMIRKRQIQFDSILSTTKKYLQEISRP